MGEYEIAAYPRWDVLSQNCPTRQIVARMGEKWTLLLLVALSGEQSTLRYSQLQQAIEGISSKALASTLRSLERDGIIDRRVLATSPVTVEYSLTDLGKSLSCTLSHLQEWTYSNVSKIRRHREMYDSLSS